MAPTDCRRQLARARETRPDRRPRPLPYQPPDAPADLIGVDGRLSSRLSRSPLILAAPLPIRKEELEEEEEE